jgi:nanoRNase/pAp phosphatase (c-di-AMP/oligoRNAs hydrolase)
MPGTPGVDESKAALDAACSDRARRKQTVRDASSSSSVLEVPMPSTGKARHLGTSFVESCLGTVADSVAAAERKSRGRPRARKLVKTLAHKKNILITTHLHPDPDALASSQGLQALLRMMLPHARVSMSIKGKVAGGINAKFAELSNLELVPWDDEKLGDYDAYILLDTQPASAYCPLPKSIEPTAVIDHHRGRHARPHCPFCDVRVDVGATSSIIFSYFMELEADITPKLGASLLFAIESDLAGAAGAPGELDNIALSSLVLIADTHTLYKMRYVELPQTYYVSYAAALNNAVFFDQAITSHLDTIDSLEKPAVMADFLLRLDTVAFSLVTAVHETRLIMSVRTSGCGVSAVDLIRKLTKTIGEGGGHRLKAGGYVPLATGSAAEISRIRDVLKRRLLRALGIRNTRGTRLVPKTAG